VDVVLDVVPFVTSDHPKLAVEAWVREQQISAHVFRHKEPAHPLRVRLPAELIDEEGRATLELRLFEPARPVDMGLSEDARRLGVHLRSLAIREPSTGFAMKAKVAAARRRLSRGLARL
jgi:hypothetical protein